MAVEQLPALKAKIDAYLKANLPKDIDQQTLCDSMCYSVDAGGKRLRPALTIVTAEIFGTQITKAVMHAACALELLHTYSLIHDDLPAMDNDDLRRGLPTNHVKYGAGMATLAGDGLLTLAFQWLTDNDLPDHTKTKLVLALAKAAGPSGMVAGQARDIEGVGQQLNLDQLRYLHRQKTGALLRYAVVAGGILSGENDTVLDALATFGARFGLAFQIKDDILDVTSTPEELGKPVHQDAAENKNTYPELLGLAGARQKLTEAVASARKQQKKLAQLTKRPFDGYDQFLAYFKD